MPVTQLCKVLEVSRSGFYAWQTRSDSRHARRDRQLRVLVRASFEVSRQRYGSPRIHEDLIEQRQRVSRKRVVRLMQEEGLKARPRTRFKCTTRSDHDHPVAANLLDRQFTAAGPNQRWVGDTSEFLIGSGTKLYLAAILDLFSRFIVGWALSAVNDRHLTITALEMALTRRGPGAGLLHHSDQGCTYASEDYQDILDARGITCSMSRKGNCWDNAVMESFFSTVKSELGSRASSRSMSARISRTRFASSPATRMAGGKGIRWWSRPPTSLRGGASEEPPGSGTSWNASRASTPTRSATSSRSTIRRPGQARGVRRFRW